MFTTINANKKMETVFQFQVERNFDTFDEFWKEFQEFCKNSFCFVHVEDSHYIKYEKLKELIKMQT